MAKAKIVNHIADSKYSVIFYHDMVRINQYIESFTAYKNKADTDVIRYEGTLEDLKTAVTDFQELLNKTTNDYIECLATDEEDFQDCQEIKSEVTKVNEHYMTALNDLAAGEIMLSTAELRVARATAELERLNALTGEEEMEIWTVDLCDRPEGQDATGDWVGHSPIIPPDTIVATIDVFNFETRIYDHWIVPSADDRDNAYDEELNGISGNVLSNNGNAFVYNINMRGPQAAWDPYFRLATITAVNDGIPDLNVDYDILKDYSGITYNTQDEEKNKNIGIDYCSYFGVCDTAEPFEVDDKVIVHFSGNKMTEAEVIGYQSNPKPCQSWVHSLISNSYRQPEETDINFCKIADPAVETQYISKNDLQISDNANSRTWSEFDLYGDIVRQLVTITTNVSPLDDSITTDGMPSKLYVTRDGVYIAKITTPLSKYIGEDLVRRTVSPAFFYIDSNGVERIAVITATTHDLNTGMIISGCDVSRWSAIYDASATAAVELSEDEIVNLDVAGEIKHLITLNQSGTKAALTIGGKGVIFHDINAPFFAPTLTTVVDIPSHSASENPEVISGQGSEGQTIGIQYARIASPSNCNLSYGGMRRDADVYSENTEVRKSITSTLDTNNPGRLKAFGYDVLSDQCNVVIERLLMIRRDLKTTYDEERNYVGYDSDTPEWEQDDKTDVETRDTVRTDDITADNKASVEIIQIPDTMSSVSPSGTAIKELIYSDKRKYERNIIDDKENDIDTDEVTNTCTYTNERFDSIDVIDIATKTIQLNIVRFEQVNDSFTETIESVFYADPALIALKSSSTSGSANIRLANAAGGTKGTVTTEYEPGDCAKYPDSGGCGSWECQNPPSCTKVYSAWGNEGNTIDCNVEYSQAFTSTWIYT